VAVPPPGGVCGPEPGGSKTNLASKIEIQVFY